MITLKGFIYFYFNESRLLFSNSSQIKWLAKHWFIKSILLSNSQHLCSESYNCEHSFYSADVLLVICWTAPCKNCSALNHRRVLIVLMLLQFRICGAVFYSLRHEKYCWLRLSLYLEAGNCLPQVTLCCIPALSFDRRYWLAAAQAFRFFFHIKMHCTINLMKAEMPEEWVNEMQAGLKAWIGSTRATSSGSRENLEKLGSKRCEAGQFYSSLLYQPQYNFSEFFNTV